MSGVPNMSIEYADHVHSPSVLPVVELATAHGLARNTAREPTGEWFLIIWRSVINTCVLVAWSLCSTASLSDEILELSVTERDGESNLRMISVLDAPADYVYQVITDYKHAYRINPTITEVEVLPSGHDGGLRVKNRSEHQVGLFSFELEWVGDIVETEYGRIKITTIPEMGSFQSGAALWEIRPLGERTWVLHESSLKPKFFVIPVIGDYIMKKQMKDEALATFDRIECNAKIMSEMDMEGDPEHLKVVLKEKENCIQPDGYQANRQ
jgi:hypothetical protein